MKLVQFTIVTAGFLFASCKPEVLPAETIIQTVEAEIPEEDLFNYDTLTGIYLSDFGGSDIRIVLNYVSKNNAIGYNIHKGLQRNINGPVRRNGDSILMTLNEPGDHEYDGVFELVFIGNDTKPTGSWRCNNGIVGSKLLVLEKRIRAQGDSDEITESNFTQFFGYMYDSIGNFNFEEDGLCIFDYYPKEDEASRVEQLIEIKGTWCFKEGVVKIDWQANDFFKSGPMFFEVGMDDEEYGVPFLKNEDHKIYNHFW